MTKKDARHRLAMTTDETASVTVAGKTAVLIGATSGIGRALAVGFADDGANVVASSRTADRVAATAAEIRDAGAETLQRTCDATERSELRDLRDAVIDRFGTIDIMVYSPSYIAREGVATVSDQEWADVLSVHLTGAHRATQLFAEEMEQGAILHIASVSAQTAIPNLAAYSAAKGGLDTYIRVTADELGPAIRVNGIRPGFFVSEQTQGTYTEGEPRFETIKQRTTSGRLGDPAELVGAAIYLASDAASYTTGEILTVDDGFMAATFAD